MRNFIATQILLISLLTGGCGDENSAQNDTITNSDEIQKTSFLTAEAFRDSIGWIVNLNDAPLKVMTTLDSSYSVSAYENYISCLNRDIARLQSLKFNPSLKGSVALFMAAVEVLKFRKIEVTGNYHENILPKVLIPDSGVTSYSVRAEYESYLRRAEGPILSNLIVAYHDFNDFHHLPFPPD